MKNKKHKKLYAQLMESKFNFINSGCHNMKDIYSSVKNEFPELCDDEVICADVCTQGTQNPEWQHRVRSALQKLKTPNGSISKDTRHGYWVFKK